MADVIIRTRERAQEPPRASLGAVALMICFSFFTHWGLIPLGYWILEDLGLTARITIEPPPGPVEIELAAVEPIMEEPEPEVEEPEPEPVIEEPEPEPERPPRPRDEPEPEPAPGPPPLAEELVQPEEIVDLSGVTLVSSAMTGFAVSAGSGEDRSEPIRRPRRPGRPDGVVGGMGGGGDENSMGTAVVPLRSLSRRPGAPPTDRVRQCMNENYPPGARNQGIEGVARVSIRINPDGTISPLSVRSESIEGQGFGRACMQCLRGTRFGEPQLGEGGQRVATRTSWTCTFAVRN